MSQTPLSKSDFSAPAPQRSGGFAERDVARYMVQGGTVSARDMAIAMAEAHQLKAPLDQVLLSNTSTPPGALLQALALAYGTFVLDPDLQAIDPDTVARLDPAFCLRHTVLPWSQANGRTLIVVDNPDTFLNLRADLQDQLGRVHMALLPRTRIEAEVVAHHGADLAVRAETQLAPEFSSRQLPRLTPLRATMALVAACAFGTLLALAPDLFVIGLVGIALVSLVMAQVLKAAAFVSGVTRRAPAPVAPLLQPPVVSLIVPLHDEKTIAQQLIRRLQRLTYPRSQLDVLLTLEDGDTATRTALDQIDLPAWMRIVTVPKGSVTTKPRALNYALNFARGEIIGIYDAEDAPDPDQVDRIAARFAAAPANVACLQGILDYYNPHANWLARCFTIEYATWFRILLPGLARLGFAIPLGGTTVFFRRSALDQVGGWDSHNVTEDADMGLRLARHGLRTEVIDTVTQEEANNRVWPWVRQRSRWLKGYMVTYMVHMRSPVALWRDLGAWQFFGVQLIFLTAILQFLLAPALWSFWLVLFGLDHAYAAHVADWLLTVTLVLFIGCEVVSMLVGFAAVARTGHPWLAIWVPSMMLYFPLGVLAVYKALYEVVFKPHFWDKTAHGLSEPQISAVQPPQNQV